VWIDRLECAGICSYSDCNGLCMQDQQEVAGFDGGSSLIMEWYAVAGLTTMAVLMGIFLQPACTQLKLSILSSLLLKLTILSQP